MTLSFVSAMPIGLAALCDEFFDEMTSDAIESAFRVPATLRSLTFVRCALALVLDREPWSPEDSGRLLLAASEAVSNAIEHGSPVDGGQIEVQVIVQRDGATLIVTDEGSGADPPAIDPLSDRRRTRVRAAGAFRSCSRWPTMSMSATSARARASPCGSRSSPTAHPEPRTRRPDRPPPPGRPAT